MQTSTVGNHVYLADFDDSRTIRHIGSHLACFHGGNWLFGLFVLPTCSNSSTDLVNEQVESY